MLNYFEKLFQENVILPSLVFLYSNLEHKVLDSRGVLLRTRIDQRLAKLLDMGLNHREAQQLDSPIIDFLGIQVE